LSVAGGEVRMVVVAAAAAHGGGDVAFFFFLEPELCPAADAAGEM
jgi:hypothetical protein